MLFDIQKSSLVLGILGKIQQYLSYDCGGQFTRFVGGMVVSNRIMATEISRSLSIWTGTAIIGFWIVVYRYDSRIVSRLIGRKIQLSKGIEARIPP